MPHADAKRPSEQQNTAGQRRMRRAKQWAVVNTDNFGGDYPNESFVGSPHATREGAQAEADRLNIYEQATRYFKVEALPYTLQPGFEP